MSLFGETGVTPGPEGQRPNAPVPARPPTRRYRRPAVVVLAALAVALMLNVAEVNLLEPDPVSTQPTRLGNLMNDVGPTPQEIALGRIVADGMEQTQTDPVAWAHVIQVSVFTGTIVIQVDTSSDGVVERVCKQARRYMFSPSPYGPKLRALRIYSTRGQHIGLDDRNDACIAR
jgi:hypothetical protein